VYQKPYPRCWGDRIIQADVRIALLHFILAILAALFKSKIGSWSIWGLCVPKTLSALMG
jgi:hypothetical protein